MSHRGHQGAPVFLNDDEDEDFDGNACPSDTDDDDEERLDCVHDIHGDGEEADVEEADCEDDFSTEHQVNINDELPSGHDRSLERDRKRVV